MENRITAHQLCLFADRTSTAFFWSNHIRLSFASVAYCLMQALRQRALAERSWRAPNVQLFATVSSTLPPFCGQHRVVSASTSAAHTLPNRSSARASPRSGCNQRSTPSNCAYESLPDRVWLEVVSRAEKMNQKLRISPQNSALSVVPIILPDCRWVLRHNILPDGAVGGSGWKIVRHAG